MVASVETLRPVTTWYEGVAFRSRLEARWARFFDQLGEPWLYEAEAFGLPSGRYLPDFFLPRLDAWLEIKPFDPTPAERHACLDLCNATAQRVIVAFGPFGCWLDPLTANRYAQTSLRFACQPGPDGPVCIGPDDRYWPCVCPVCRRFGFEYEGRGARVCGGRCCPDDDHGHSFDDPEILKSVAMAQKESFWR